MKFLNYIFLNVLILVFFNACEDGIDSISRVDPGPDESDPVVIIKYPSEGVQIKVPEPVTSINIKFEVTDDIEIESISVSMDGNEIANFNDFKDYRHAIKEYLYDNVVNGE